MYASRFGALSLVALLAACGSKNTTPGGPEPQAAAPVNAARLMAADSEPGN